MRVPRWARVVATAALVGLAYYTGGSLQAAARRPAAVVTAVPTGNKVVALTFDDGPTARWTPKILQGLLKAHVRATFFVIGTQATRYPLLVQEEVRDGMEIGNHGSGHLLLRGRSASAVRTEVTEGAAAIEAAGGPPPTLYRMPAGVYDSTALEVLGSLGYTVIGWTVDPMDWRHRLTAAQMVRLVLGQVRPGSIIIFHDGPNSSQATVDAVLALVRHLVAEGYRLVTVSQLLRQAEAVP